MSGEPTRPWKTADSCCGDGGEWHELTSAIEFPLPIYALLEKDKVLSFENGRRGKVGELFVPECFYPSFPREGELLEPSIRDTNIRG
jgi:hypothetical protein